MSSNPVKYEVLTKQYLRSILDISGVRNPIYIPKNQNLKVHVNYVQGSLTRCHYTAGFCEGSLL